MTGGAPFDHDRSTRSHPVERYLQLQSDTDRDDIDVAYTDHFWGYSTDYDAPGNDGDYTTLEPFMEDIRTVAQDHVVYDIDIRLSASERGIRHEAWTVYGDRPFINTGSTAVDGLFEHEQRRGITDDIMLDMAGYYVGYSTALDAGQTPADTIIAEVNDIADTRPVYDVQFNDAAASSGHYYEAWVICGPEAEQDEL